MIAETCFDDVTIQRACRHVWQRAGVRSCEYEDVLQEVRVEMWLGRYRMYGKPRGYILQSAQRGAWRAIRRLCNDELVLGVANFDG